MTCKITARLKTPRFSGVLSEPEKIRGGVSIASPIVDGWYSDGVRQTRQFQQVLEELRLQHQPEHWASWALDGSLEEDGGQFPLLMQGGWEWADVGPRRAVKFDGSNDAGLIYGTDEDFQWVHEERVFTIAFWCVPSRDGSFSAIGTNDGLNTTTPGFSTHTTANGNIQLYLPYAAAHQIFQPNWAFPNREATFYVYTGTGTGGIYRAGVNTLFGVGSYGQQSITGEPRLGHSYNPLTIGWRSKHTIWNCFVTSQVLTDAEIYRLYVAGMQELMEF